MIKTAFFGGSFNPPHPGHLAVAAGALRSGRTDRILFVPAYAPPHKPGRPMAPFADRVNMVKLLIQGQPGMEVSEIEARLRLSPSYTFDILNALANELDGPLQLLIGGDSLRDLHTWYRAEDLVRHYEILTYPRREETPTRSELAVHWPADLVQKLMRGVLTGSFFEISSTKIRKSMAKASNPVHINSDGVPECIEEYIRHRNLYSEEQ